MTDVEHAKKYAEESISLAISMYNPKAEMIAETACLYGLTYNKEQIDTLSKHILELQADKGRLTDRVRELEVQIEKMKNCKNCANYMISGKCPCFFRTDWCENWEMAKGVSND